MFLNFAEIGELLSAVEIAGGRIPDAFRTDREYDIERVKKQRDDLAFAISWAVTRRDAHQEWTSNARNAARYKALEAVLKATRGILGGLESDAILRQTLSNYFPVVAEYRDDVYTPSFHDLTAGLSLLRSAIEVERKALRKAGLDKSAPLANLDDPAVELTATASFMQGLVNAYEAAFETDAHIVYNSLREPGGPFVAFVSHICEKMGEPTTAEAIRKRLDRLSPSDKTGK